jgi:hypothetical protein
MISPLASFSFCPTGPSFCLLLSKIFSVVLLDQCNFKFNTVVGVKAVSAFIIPDGNDMCI